MRFEKEDPRLIDYALGELDANTARTVEAGLCEDDNDAARKEIEQIKRIAALAHIALKRREGAATLTEQQRTEVLLHAEKEPGSHSFRWILAAGLSLAAAILVFFYTQLSTESLPSITEEGRHVPATGQPVAKKSDLPPAPKEAPGIAKAPLEPKPLQETPPSVNAVPVPETTKHEESTPVPHPSEKQVTPVPAAEIKETAKPQPAPMKMAKKSEATPNEEKRAPQEEDSWKPMEIQLPEPFFGGTPLDYWSPNLEPEDYKDRPPYLAPPGTAVVSKGKPVTSSCGQPSHGDLKQITDGDKDYAKASLVELASGVQWVQIDLEQEYDLYAILVWHFHEGKRVYFDIVAQASNDPDFKTGVTTLYNNDYDNSSGLGVGKDKEYIENNRGRLIAIPKGIRARYVRLYSNGNTANELNNYVDVEVFGKPLSAETEVKDAGSSEREPIEIELPEPHFSGTPIDYWSPQLEPEDYKDRPPYLAPKGVLLASRDKPVTSSCSALNFGNLKQITDGNKDYVKKSLVELDKGTQWIQLDLQQEYTIYAIMVWHFYEDRNLYFDVILRTSNDPNFQQGAIEIYNNDFDNSSGLGAGKDLEYIESYKGRLFPIPDGVPARYIRLYSQGNYRNEFNHYVEVEVFGKPVPFLSVERPDRS